MNSITTATATAETTSLLPVLQEETKNLPSVIGAMAIQSPDNVQPVRPEHVTDERDAEIRAQARAVVDAILANPSDIKVTAQIYALGQNAQAANTNNISLMDTRIGPVMKEIGTESTVGKSLTQIKAQLDLVNPHVVGQTAISFTDSITKPRLWGLLGQRIVNEVVTRLPAGRNEVMALINERRDTIRSTIETLKGHLWTERDKALRNAIELGQVANHLADAQDELQEAAYQGQLIWAMLNDARVEETDPVRKQSLDYLTTDLAMKIVDLQTVDQLNIQSRLGAETLINNCRGIQQLVHRVTNVLLPSVQTALAVKAAASQQAQLAEASRGIMAAASDTIARTATDIRQVTVDVARMNTEALVDLDKLEEAADQYEKMNEELAVVMVEAERNARAVSNRLNELNDRMRKTADPLTEARRAKEEAGA
jgi:uncharacterized protein YaaN involved in tellurite resistance